MSAIQLIAVVPSGLEAIAARELKRLGYEDLMVESGKITFAAEERAICRSNLWLRCAERVLVKIAEFPAKTPEELYEGVRSAPWHEWIPEDGAFPVTVECAKSALYDAQACQAIVKKAAADKLAMKYRKESLPETGACFRIDVSLLNDLATVALDTSGAALDERGYRRRQAAPAVRETTAAAVVRLSRWTPDRPLYDPFCGSGTFLIEAAMIGWNIAPGLRRTYPSEHWPRIAPSMWKDAREEAFDLVRDDVPLQLAGSDPDPEAVERARAYARAAGLGGDIRYESLPVEKMKAEGQYGVIATHLPQVEPSGASRESDAALRQLAARFQSLETWSAFILSPAKQLEHYFPRKADRKQKMSDGRLDAQLFQFLGPSPPNLKRA